MNSVCDAIKNKTEKYIERGVENENNFYSIINKT